MFPLRSYSVIRQRATILLSALLLTSWRDSKLLRIPFTTTVMISTSRERDLTQSYDKSPYANRNVKRTNWQHKQRHKKVRLHSGCGPTLGRSVGVTTATQLVLLTWFTGPTFPLPTSITQTVRSWVLGFHLLFSRSSYDIPGFSPLINILFWGQRDCQKSFSERDLSGISWNRLLWSSMAGNGI